jgi:hypothetical protein
VQQSDRFKDILACAAERAAPIFRNILKGGTGGDAVVRVTHSRIILILTDGTDIRLHWFSPFVMNYSDTAERFRIAS